MPKKNNPPASTNTISIKVQPDPAASPTFAVDDIPWFAGITVLQAMIIADAMTDATFSFRAVYASSYGAFIDKINGLEDQGGKYWMLFIDQKEADVGVSEALLLEQAGQNVEVEWKYLPVPSSTPAGSQVSRKIRAMKLV